MGEHLLALVLEGCSVDLPRYKTCPLTEPRRRSITLAGKTTTLSLSHKQQITSSNTKKYDRSLGTAESAALLVARSMVPYEATGSALRLGVVS